MLLSSLEQIREAVVRTMEGVSDEEVRRPGVVSGTSLLGILHHLTGIEAERTREQVVAAYRRRCARSNEIVDACQNLGTRAAIPNEGEERRGSLRVILGHMVEETARHAGHADILREQVDGTTGL